MKNITPFALILVLLCFTACDLSMGYRVNTLEDIAPTFRVIINNPNNGSIRAFPETGVVGSEIMLAVNAEPGYRIKDSSFIREIGGELPVADLYPPYRFALSNDTFITGEFEKLPGGMYSASAVQTTGGTIIVYSQDIYFTGERILENPYGWEGKEIHVYFYPDKGYILKEGSVEWILLGPGNIPLGSTALLPPYTFSLPAGNVSVQAEFEIPSAADEFIEGGKNALLRNDYDSAVIAFETAWKMDPQNKDAIFYSTLGKLASITVDLKVRQFMATCGFSGYPTCLNNMFSLGDSWKNYEKRDEQGSSEGWDQRPGWLGSFSGVILPNFANPSGIYVFQNQVNIVQEGKDPYGNYSIANWYFIMFLNLMSTRIQNLNYIPDDALRYIFGDSFEAAAARAATLDYNDTIQMDQAVIDKLFLEDILDDGDHVGRAELDVLFGYLRIIKAGLEWISGYDLEFDRYLFRMWSFRDSGDEILPLFMELFDEINKNYLDIDDDTLYVNRGFETQGINFLINNVIAYLTETFDRYFVSEQYPEHGYDINRIQDMLPLRNHFLKTQPRAQTMMKKSRDNLGKAFGLFQNACNYYFDPAVTVQSAVKDELNNGEYDWMPDYVTKFKNAVDSGGTFYYPDDLPTSGNTWNYNASNADNGINLGKLFTPGQLSLDKMIVTESGGKIPKFFGWGAGKSGDGVYANSGKDLDSYEWSGFKFDLRSLKQIYVKGLRKDDRVLQDIESVHNVFPEIILTGDNAKYLYRLYYDQVNYYVE